VLEMTKTGFKCRLKVILAEKEIPHGDFAKKVNLSSGALSNIINNKSLPAFETLYEICTRLERDFREIWVKVDE
jgi:putative transcriptional regulator